VQGNLFGGSCFKKSRYLGNLPGFAIATEDFSIALPHLSQVCYYFNNFFDTCKFLKWIIGIINIDNPYIDCKKQSPISIKRLGLKI